jgi:hypothetical protein
MKDKVCTKCSQWSVYDWPTNYWPQIFSACMHAHGNTILSNALQAPHEPCAGCTNSIQMSQDKTNNISIAAVSLRWISNVVTALCCVGGWSTAYPSISFFFCQSSDHFVGLGRRHQTLNPKTPQPSDHFVGLGRRHLHAAVHQRPGVPISSASDATSLHRKHLAPFGTENRTLGPYLAAMHRIHIPAMIVGEYILERAPERRDGQSARSATR